MTTNKTWILLRGLGREKGHWGPFLENFQEHFPGDDLLAIDLPGTGEFRDVTGPASIKQIFQFVRAKVIERVPANNKFCLVAISLGGMVALEWLNQSPEDLIGTVLINTSSKALSPLYYRMRWQVWRDFLKLAANPQTRLREKSLIDLLINSEEARALAFPLWNQLAVEHPVGTRTSVHQLWAAFQFEGLKKKSDVPVLLLNSLGDRLVDPSCSTALHDKWGWPIERHPWAGHDLPWDDGPWVLQQIAAWTNSNNAQQN